MMLQRERELIVQYGQQLVTAGLTKGTSGNLSVYHRELGLMAISPSGIAYSEVTPEDAVVLDLAGLVVEGTRTPSSEKDLHLMVYRRRKDLCALIHTHPVYATTLACLRWDLPPVHYMIALAGRNVRCAEYAPFGTPELAVHAYEAMIDRNAVLLANHGLLAGAGDLPKAFSVTEEVEYCAELYYRSLCIGKPVILTEDEMTLMLEKFKTYGQPANSPDS